jgi:hypothetical protein
VRAVPASGAAAHHASPEAEGGGGCSAGGWIRFPAGFAVMIAEPSLSNVEETFS